MTLRCTSSACDSAVQMTVEVPQVQHAERVVDVTVFFFGRITRIGASQSSGMRRVTRLDRSPCNLEQNSGHKNTSSGRQKSQIHQTRPSKSTHAENLREDRIDSPIHTEYFLSGEANTLKIIAGNPSDRSTCVHQFLETCKAVPPDGTTWRAQPSGRRCHSCETTPSTNHAVSAEDGGDSSESEVPVAKKRQTSLILQVTRTAEIPQMPSICQSIASGTSLTSASRTSETSKSAAHHQDDRCAMASVVSQRHI